MRPVGPLIRREADRPRQRGAERGVQAAERLVPPVGRHVQHRRPGRRSEGAESAQPDPERAGAGRRFVQRADDRGNPVRVRLADEMQRDVPVGRMDPAGERESLPPIVQPFEQPPPDIFRHGQPDEETVLSAQSTFLPAPDNAASLPFPSLDAFVRSLL